MRARVIVVSTGERHPGGDVTGRWSYALLKGLAAKNYRVRCLACSSRPEWARAAADAVTPLGIDLTCHGYAHERMSIERKWRTVRAPFSYMLSDDLRRTLDAEVRNGYDVLQLEQLWAGHLANGHPRTVTSVHHLELLDLEGVWYASPRFIASKALLYATERRLLSRLRTFRATTNRVAQRIAQINGSAAVRTIPVVIDPDAFSFNAADRPTPSPTIGFVANMAWSPGYLAAVRLITSIFPMVRARIPDARLLIVGWNARTALSQYLGSPGIEIHQNVPDPRPYFEQLGVFTYPLPRGSGTMIKVLEAMAYGIPVVTTSEGAEGIDVEHGVHARVADDDEAFSESVVELLRDANARRQMRTAARQLIVERYHRSFDAFAQPSSGI